MELKVQLFFYSIWFFFILYATQCYKLKKKRGGEARRPNRNYRSYERLGLIKLWHYLLWAQLNSEQLEHCCWHWGVPQTKEQSFNFFLMWGFLFLGHETIALDQAPRRGMRDKKWGETATKMVVKWAVSGVLIPFPSRLPSGLPLFTDLSFLPFFLMGSLIPGHEAVAQ